MRRTVNLFAASYMPVVIIIKPLIMYIMIKDYVLQHQVMPKAIISNSQRIYINIFIPTMYRI